MQFVLLAGSMIFRYNSNPRTAGYKRYYEVNLLFTLVSNIRKYWNQKKNPNIEVFRFGVYRNAGSDTIVQ